MRMPPLQQRRQFNFGQFIGSGKHPLRSLRASRRLKFAASSWDHLHPVGLGDLQNVGYRLIFHEVSRNPHLLDATPLSQQKFTHGLTTLNLLTTKGSIFGTTLGRSFAGRTHRTGPALTPSDTDSAPGRGTFTPTGSSRAGRARASRT